MAEGFLDGFFYTSTSFAATTRQRPCLPCELESSATASATAVAACIPTWLTDFRPDLAKIDVRDLAPWRRRQRAADGTTPRGLRLIKDLRTVVISGARTRSRGPMRIINAALLHS